MTASRRRPRLARLPLRLRLVAGFSAASLVVLLGAGAFVYWRVEYALDRGLDTELSHAATTLRPLVGTDGRVLDRAAASATGVAWQVLDDDGVDDHGGPAGDRPLLGPAALEALGATPATVDVGGFLPASDAPYRLLVSRLSDGRTLVVGVRRDHRDEALRELLLQLGIAGAGTLLVTAIVGDRLARAALRPVERYRRRAAQIADGDPSLRVEVPPDRDDEITRLGHTFNDMLTGLQTAMERERRFVHEASHELRTPITLLSSRIQLALRRPRTVDEHERILGELKIDLDRLAALAEQLLDLGRAGDRDGRCDLVAVVERTLARLRMADPARAAGVLATLPEEPVVVPLVEVEAERVLINLLDNAHHHGRAPVRITLHRTGQGRCVLAVSDSGEGMPPDLLGTAHQRFVRADAARSRPGSGLGLAMVEALALGAGGALCLCHDGHHVTRGDGEVPSCCHDDAMTVSVVLPVLLDQTGSYTDVDGDSHPG